MGVGYHLIKYYSFAYSSVFTKLPESMRTCKAITILLLYVSVEPEKTKFPKKKGDNHYYKKHLHGPQ
jgi:hypothetical protein